MSSPKILAYKAVIELTQLLTDALKNPQSIAEAGKQLADAVALSDSENSKREESLNIIASAKEQMDDLAVKKRAFELDYSNRISAIEAKQLDAESAQKLAMQKQENADAKYASAINIKSEADDRFSKAEIKENDIAKREKNYADSILEFENQKANILSNFDEREKILLARESEVTMRENKIKEAFGVPVESK